MWQSENVKPPDFQTVFLYLIGDDVTTGWYSSKAASWIGLALNQSPPTYRIEPGFVTHWQIIERPTPLTPDLPIGVPEFPCFACTGAEYHFPGCPHRQTGKA